ncbi:MAG: PDZ domain-containing protein [Ignavibacteriales bacterium]|nr:PDZ domain-containing protein [Ignavibacteriales bacterium]
MIPDDETQANVFDSRRSSNLQLAEVVKDSPAEKAGIQAGDIIISLNGIAACTAQQQSTEIISANAGKELQA